MALPRKRRYPMTPPPVVVNVKVNGSLVDERQLGAYLARISEARKQDD